MTPPQCCSNCGAEIPSDAPAGLCALCLLAPGLESAGHPPPLEPADLTPILTKRASPLVVQFHFFGDYELLAEVARGGMGVVFRARQISLNRIVALKFIHPGRLNSPEAGRRFQIEAEAAASLNHPNIVTIYSVEQVNQMHFISMELVDGRPLSELIPAGGLAVASLISLAIPLTDALASAHSRGIGHRDLKPSNVMVNDQGRVKVIDFGLAKLVQTDAAPSNSSGSALHSTGDGSILGTPAYMSPEQIERRKIDHRTDIFSLGILLYEMATARSPFNGSDSASLMSSILKEVPRPLAELKPGVPERLDRIVGRCLQKDPDDRYQSALEVRDELRRVEEELQASIRSTLNSSGKITPATAPVRNPNNLPVPLTSFIGREVETVEVTRLIAGASGNDSGRTRLLTLTGPGGTGKTRLALQVAAALLERFPDGVWLIELASLSDPSLVPQTVATGMGLLNTAGGSPLEPLTRYFAQKRALLVLDNCEHLIAACADLTETLLKSCPRLQFLVTSREGLRLAGEIAWPVRSLSVPRLDRALSGKEALDVLRQYEAVRLFVERAKAVAPGFELNEQNAAPVAELCQRLDGIPLAIELAAARTRLLPVQQLLDRVQDCFRLLTGGSRTALPRQQTLRALVDWSYDLLSEKERLLFDRLSVFAGGWTLEAAEAVCAGDEDGAGSGGQICGGGLPAGDILDHMGRLLEKSMIMAEQSAGSSVRYRLLETLRHYAQERLESRGESATGSLRTRHATYFATLGETAALGMHGPDQAQWLDRLELEHDNLRSGLDWGKAAEATQDRVELALRLAAPLYLPWLRQGHGREGRLHFESLLAHRNGQRPTRARAQVLFAVGSFALWQDGDATACELLNESLSLAEHLGDTQVMAEARHNLGVVHSNRGDHAGARLHHEEALRLTRANGDVSGIRWALEDLADVADDEGNHSQAAELREEALKLARQLSDHHAVGSMLQTMGNLARTAGNTDRATELISEGLDIMQRIGCQHCCARCLRDLAFVAGASGDFERAVNLLGAADALSERTGIVIPTPSVQIIERTLADSRHDLGEEVFASAWSKGMSMSLPQATAYALRQSTLAHSAS